MSLVESHQQHVAVMNEALAVMMVIGNQQIGQLLDMTWRELVELVEPVLEVHQKFVPKGIL